MKLGLSVAPTGLIPPGELTRFVSTVGILTDPRNESWLKALSDWEKFNPKPARFEPLPDETLGSLEFTTDTHSLQSASVTQL